MSPKFWEYYLSIEADLAACSRFVEFTEANYATYSTEFARIIVAAAAEIDAILSELCGVLDPRAKAGTINQYHPIICTQFPVFTQCGVEVRRSHLFLEPWRGWEKGQSPNWWGQGYNKIKHDRTNHFQEANLLNALQAVGALFLTILHFHHHGTNRPMSVDMNRGAQLFTPAKAEGDKSGTYWFYGVPQPRIAD